MSGDSKIEWTDATWNPTTGCDRVSPGCDHCYAMTLAPRLKAMGSAHYQRDGDPKTSGPGFGVSTHADALDWPLRKDGHSPGTDLPCEAWPGGLDWVIAGGESGKDARPMHPDWARSLRDQCTAASVAFHFKQWGEWAPAGYQNGTHLLQTTGQVIDRKAGTVENPYGHGSGKQDLVDRGHPGWVRIRRPGKKFAGRELDGRTWDEFPEPVTA